MKKEIKEGKVFLKKLHYLFSYRKDLLNEKEREELQIAQKKLKKSLKEKDKEQIKKTTKTSKQVWKKLTKNQPITSWREQIESLFVALVIAFAIRCYFLQPFRIPTGSMQPSLNGVRISEVAKAEFPPLPIRWLERITHGRRYFHLAFPQDKYLASPNLSQCVLSKQNYFGQYTILIFINGEQRKIPIPSHLLWRDLQFRQKLKPSSIGLPMIPKNTEVFSGYISSGDLILVNKMAYHFRSPKRGEVFIFNTIGINKINQKFGGQSSGTHYIKRLAGIPKDTLEIKKPYLFINGEKAKEKQIMRVSQQEEYKGYRNASNVGIPLFLSKGQQIFLKPSSPLESEYFALGDNTINSFDSRYWGTVKGYNLVGSNGWVLWPFFGTGHWGKIK